MQKISKNKVFKDLVIPVLIAAAIVFTFTRFFGIGLVDGHSMEPTYSSGRPFIYHKTTDVDRGDIVVFYTTKLKANLVKRVIAKGGDKLELRDGNVYVNDTRVVEKYIKEKDTATNLKLTIPRGYIFVMGDNRNHSVDSRRFGLIASKYIYGKKVL